MASDEPALSMAAHGSAPQPSCPAFLSKLWLLVEDESTDDLIEWSEEGNSFIVTDQALFASILLPQFFKHNNMASFIRQLNMYGFRKKAHLEDGALKTERTDIEFQHPYFLKGEIGLLERIKRKVSAKDESKLKTSDVSRILSDVREVKGKQDNISSTLDTIKNENQALWREVMTLRQRHEKQQKIVNRLIHFLISLVQPKVGGTKRRQGSHLMIEGLPDGPAPSKAKYARTIPGSATIDEIPVIGQSQESNSDLLAFSSAGSGTSLSDFTSNLSSQSKVTELLSDNDLLPKDSNITTTDTTPTITESAPTGVVGDVTSPESEKTPSTFQDVPVVSPVSPQISFPLTPFQEDSWIDDSPAELFVHEDVEILASPVQDYAEGGLGGAGDGEPGGGQLVVTSSPPKGAGIGGLPLGSDGSSGKANFHRLLSNDEQKSRHELGEQLTTVQSNLLDFQNLISSNPSLNLELGGLLSDFQDIFENPGPYTIPDLSSNDNNETGENGGTSSMLLQSHEPRLAGNELVTYKPSTSFPLGSFMDEDEDSLLRSLDNDALALKQQEEEENDLGIHL